jgi:hypothetical protein
VEEANSAGTEFASPSAARTVCLVPTIVRGSRVANLRNASAVVTVPEKIPSVAATLAVPKGDFSVVTRLPTAVAMMFARGLKTATIVR